MPLFSVYWRHRVEASQSVYDIFGDHAPTRHRISRCGVDTLKSLCVSLHLVTGFSGKRGRKEPIKQDYIEALFAYWNNAVVCPRNHLGLFVLV